MARGHESQSAPPSSSTVPKPRRQRASPSRLTKLYKDLNDAQRKRIRAIGFGGLLKIASPTLPAGFADWLMADCYDAESSELVFPGRGRVSVNADSVRAAFGLPSEGDEVQYDLDVAAINFINTAYGIHEGSAPTIDWILERLKNNKSSNDDFLRSWLMIAISTFLCPPTGLCISPRCYPPLVELHKIKKLNWCQFVVDQLKVAALNMGKRKSFRGCLLAVVLVYVDSLEVGNVQVPSTMPRVAAWSRKLLDQLINLDTNRDGSFGKLKLKASNYSTPQPSLFHMDDIRRFVSSKVPRGISDQKKKYAQHCCEPLRSGFTELLGTFLGEIYESEVPASQPVSGSKHPRANQDEGEPSSAQRHNSSKRSKLQEAVPFCAQRQTRAMSRRENVGIDEDDTASLEQPEDDLLSDESGEEEDDSEDEEDADDEEHGDSEDEGSHYEGSDNDASDSEHETSFDDDGDTNLPFDDDGDTNLPPLSKQQGEGAEKQDVEQGEGAEKQDVNVAASMKGVKQDENRVESEPDESQDFVPLKVRLERLQSLNQDKKTDTGAAFQPQPLEVIPPEPTNNPKSRSQIMREKLSLPRRDPLDFTPPEINLMQFVDSQDGPSKSAGATSTGPIEVETTCTTAFEGMTEEEFAKMENDAQIQLENRKAKPAVVFQPSGKSSVPHPPAPTSMEPGSASVTPAFVPHPRRIQRRPAALRSPYIDFATKRAFHCSKAVCDLYDAVCAHANVRSRSARSKKAEGVIIINYWYFYVTLDHLVVSVKPGGKLMSPVAEIGIYAIDNRSKKTIKRVLPLRVSTLIQEGDLNSVLVSRELSLREHHLDRRHMVMFPVLQSLGDGKSAAQVGHYFLLVLNLRNHRFEVLDSMRTLQDEALSKCCNTLMRSIKELWAKHGYEAKKPICKFDIVDIGVPIQSNNHDCGFHMLMHAEHWDGHLMQYFKETDMPNIRKLLLHKWVTHKQNVVENWMESLNF